MDKGAAPSRWSSFRSWLYDSVIVSMTAVWYRSFLVRVPMNADVLDVGIGTATSLLHNRDIVVTKRLHILGTDIDEDYVVAARENIRRCNLEQLIEIECTPKYEGSKQFDAIYFSGSFMIIPNKSDFLRHCAGKLRSATDGRVYFSQTLERPGIVGKFMTWFKPALRWLTTIDFGTVTYRADIERDIRAAGLTVEEVQIVRPGRFRDQVLIVAKLA